MFTVSVDGYPAFVEDRVQAKYQFLNEYYQAMSTHCNKEVVGFAKVMQEKSTKLFIIIMQATTGMAPLVKSWLCNTETMEYVHDNMLLIVDKMFTKNWTVSRPRPRC